MEGGWIQNYYSTDSSSSRWPPLCERARAFVCILNSIRIRGSEERKAEKRKKRWPEIGRGAHTAGVAARSGWLALPPALSTPVALESIQLQPPPVKTELTFSSTQSSSIRTPKGLWSSSWHHSHWFLLLSLVVELFNQHSAESVWNLCPRIFCLFVYFDSCMLHTFHLRGQSTGGRLLFPWLDSYGFRFSLTATSTGMETSKKLQPALSSPSSYTAPSGCFCQNSDVGAQGYDTADGGIEAYFIAALIVSCSELAHQLNDCNENVTLETSGWFLQPTRLSPKKIKWFILFRTTNIRSCLSTWRQLANVNIIPLSVSHFNW